MIIHNSETNAGKVIPFGDEYGSPEGESAPEGSICAAALERAVWGQQLKQVSASYQQAIKSATLVPGSGKGVVPKAFKIGCSQAECRAGFILTQGSESRLDSLPDPEAASLSTCPLGNG